MYLDFGQLVTFEDVNLETVMDIFHRHLTEQMVNQESNQQIIMVTSFNNENNC